MRLNSMIELLVLINHALCCKQIKKERRQVNKKGHIGIVEKAKETSSDTGMHRAITEQWMCLGMQRRTHITQCNLVTSKLSLYPSLSNTGLCMLCTFLHVQCIKLAWDSLSLADCWLVERESIYGRI